MRLSVLVLAVAACGDNTTKQDAPASPGDTTIDAPVLPACANPVGGTTVSARQIGSGLTIGDAALLVTAPTGDPRLFVVGRLGQIWIVENEQLVATPFIDLNEANGGPVRGGGELGLLGLAFHPKHHLNKTFYVYYTRNEGGDLVFTRRNVVARCKTSADPNRAEPTCAEILVIEDRFSNHNGGMIQFGKDGFLYIGTGDAGSAGDPDGNAQSLVDGSPEPTTRALMGKMLRIDVDNPSGGKDYGIPAGNPFVGGSGPPEVIALGLRNPWRWSFDAATGDVWIGDVGQGPANDPQEEINFVRAGELAGKNFGWDMFEGNNCFTPPCDATGMTPPIESRDQGDTGYHAIVGGTVYRGTCYPDLVGTYFYTDNTAGGLASATIDAGGVYASRDLPGTFPTGPTSISADARGELYITTVAGTIFHLEAGP